MAMDYCSKCGKEMTVTTEDREETSISALVITVRWDGGTKPEMVELLKKNLGRYLPVDKKAPGAVFQFCYECCLNALMGLDY